MSLFKRWFGVKNIDFERPEMIFGRYTDAYKKDEQYDFWDKALEKFEEKSYTESFELFFRYLKDPEKDNVKFWKEGRIQRFEVLQGSKKIEGTIDNKKFRAFAKIAKTDKLNIGFLRRLVEQNFGLKYSRYALDDDDNISMVFDSYLLDGSPYKLYYALKEVAVNSDKQDDVLIDEFEMLHPVNTGHTKQISNHEKEIKFWFLHKEINAALDEIENGKLDTNQYPGGVAYLLLHLIHKLDYLIKPEGYTMEKLEKMHRTYFSEELRTTEEKNHAIQKGLKKILQRSKEEFFVELYSVSSTFGITSPVNHDRLKGFIEGEINKMDWYKDNKHDKVAIAVPGYIVGFFLFNYAVPEADKDYLHLFYQITEIEFFQKLGFEINYFNPATGALAKKEIIQAIEYLKQKHKPDFPKLDPNLNILKFENLVAFSKSYLLMMKELDLSKIVIPS